MISSLDVPDLVAGDGLLNNSWASVVDAVAGGALFGGGGIALFCTPLEEVLGGLAGTEVAAVGCCANKSPTGAALGAGAVVVGVDPKSSKSNSTGADTGACATFVTGAAAATGLGFIRAWRLATRRLAASDTAPRDGLAKLPPPDATACAGAAADDCIENPAGS